MHAPLAQPAVAWLSEHPAPQALQLVGDVLRFTSQPLLATPSQLPKPVLQVIAQLPPLHTPALTLAVMQLTPHAPQLLALVAVLTHAPPQFVVPAAHPHAPPEQLCPDMHAAPHPPQLPALVAVLVSQPSAALPLQLPNPALHVITQALATQVPVATLAPTQPMPQPPQLAASVAVFTQALPQLVVPVGHAQLPPTQARPDGHARPHMPQFAELVAMFTSQPFEALRSQSAVPLGQVTPHAPPEHTAVPGVPAVQVVPHPPQFDVSVSVFTQRVPQGVVPGGHAHMPLAQVCPAGQAVPHAPQLPPSVWRFTQLPLQSVVPAPQEVRQAPLEQIWPVAHALPHAPQLATSVNVLMQRPLQSVVPLGHTQLAAEHI